MKFVCISDTHLQISEHNTPLPEGDVLIHAGDLLNRGSIEELIKAKMYFQQVSPKFKYIIFVPGNHDRIFETNEQLSRTILSEVKNLTVLIDQSMNINGIKIYGSPYQPEFCNWAFNLPRGGESLRQKWEMIPEDVDILITHGMPYGILDLVAANAYNPMSSHVGCEELLKRIKQLKSLDIYIGGHLHFNGNQEHHEEGVSFYNVAVCDEMYRPINGVRVIEYDKNY